MSMPAVDPASPSSVLSRRATGALVLAVVLAGMACLVAWGPLTVGPHDLRFADDRLLWGTPNGVHVWSHLPLLLLGVYTSWRIWQLPRSEPLRAIWCVFFLCQCVATLLGMCYHWRPTDLNFLGDQVLRSAACLLFTLAFLGERLDVRLGGALAVSVALAGTMAAGLWWYVTLGTWGAGDLRPLLLLEWLPVALILTGAWKLQGHLLTQRDWAQAQFFFLLGQCADWFDASLYQSTHQQLSGHSVRHLALALCVGVIARGLLRHTHAPDMTRLLRAHVGVNPPSVVSSQHTSGWDRGSLPEPSRGLDAQAKVTSLPDSRLAS